MESYVQSPVSGCAVVEPYFAIVVSKYMVFFFCGFNHDLFRKPAGMSFFASNVQSAWLCDGFLGKL